MIAVADVSVKNIQRNCVENSVSSLHFQKLEESLNELFMRELNSGDSIFIKISPMVIKKIAMFLSGVINRPAAIGICGETASGKSTIVLDSIEIIKNFSEEFLLENVITKINSDDYYYDRSEEVKKAGSFSQFAQNYDLDSPEAIELSLMKQHIKLLLDNKKVYLPKYDMSGTAKRFDNHELATPSSIIISEGIFTLVDGVSDVFDFKIYVDIDKSVQKKRFYERAEQRGLGASADRIFANANEKACVYIYPCAKNADIILNGEVKREKYKKFIQSLLLLVETIYYNFKV